MNGEGGKRVELKENRTRKERKQTDFLYQLVSLPDRVKCKCKELFRSNKFDERYRIFLFSLQIRFSTHVERMGGREFLKKAVEYKLAKKVLL